MSEFWDIPEELEEEGAFQLEALRELRKKHGIPDDSFELYLFKLALLSYRIGINNDETVSLNEFFSIDYLLRAMEPLFKDFSVIANEQENQNAKRC